MRGEGGVKVKDLAKKSVLVFGSQTSTASVLQGEHKALGPTRTCFRVLQGPPRCSHDFPQCKEHLLLLVGKKVGDRAKLSSLYYPGRVENTFWSIYYLQLPGRR